MSSSASSTNKYELLVDTDVVRGNVVRVTTVSYEYYVLDTQDAELLAFHWAPRPQFRGPDFPHLHVSAPLTIKTGRFGGSRQSRLDTVHIPTGRISLESVIRLLVDELNVQARFHDWEERLKRTEATFRSTRTRA